MGKHPNIIINDEYGDYFIKEIIKENSRKYGKYKYIIKCKKCPNQRKIEGHLLSKLKKCRLCSNYERIGKKNGMLTLKEYLGKGIYRSKCDCGNFHEGRERARHCGCQTTLNKACEYKVKVKTKPEDYIGKKYGKLKIIKYIGIIKNQRIFMAKCDCRNIIKVRKGHFNFINSCGCIQKSSVPRGSKSWNAKHTENDIITLKELYQTDIYSKEELCEIFNINRAELLTILSNKKWKDASPKEYVPLVTKKIPRINYKEYLGKKINKWTILEHKQETNKILIKCDCGYVCERDPHHIITGKSRSCHKCSSRLKDYSYLNGKKFGSQTILYTFREGCKIYGNVKCDCGNERIILIHHITQGEFHNCQKCYKNKF